MPRSNRDKNKGFLQGIKKITAKVSEYLNERRSMLLPYRVNGYEFCHDSSEISVVYNGLLDYGYYRTLQTVTFHTLSTVRINGLCALVPEGTKDTHRERLNKVLFFTINGPSENDVIYYYLYPYCVPGTEEPLKTVEGDVIYQCYIDGLCLTPLRLYYHEDIKAAQLNEDYSYSGVSFLPVKITDAKRPQKSQDSQKKSSEERSQKTYTLSPYYKPYCYLDQNKNKGDVSNNDDACVASTLPYCLRVQSIEPDIGGFFLIPDKLRVSGFFGFAYFIGAWLFLVPENIVKLTIVCIHALFELLDSSVRYFVWQVKQGLRNANGPVAVVSSYFIKALLLPLAVLADMLFYVGKIIGSLLFVVHAIVFFPGISLYYGSLREGFAHIAMQIFNVVITTVTVMSEFILLIPRALCIIFINDTNHKNVFTHILDKLFKCSAVIYKIPITLVNLGKLFVADYSARSVDIAGATGISYIFQLLKQVAIDTFHIFRAGFFDIKSIFVNVAFGMATIPLYEQKGLSEKMMIKAYATESVLSESCNTMLSVDGKGSDIKKITLRDFMQGFFSRSLSFRKAEPKKLLPSSYGRSIEDDSLIAENDVAENLLKPDHSMPDHRLSPQVTSFSSALPHDEPGGISGDNRVKVDVHRSDDNQGTLTGAVNSSIQEQPVNKDKS